MSRLSFSVVYLSLFMTSAWAVNDWSQPCLQGICSYDISQSNSSLGGTLIIVSAIDMTKDLDAKLIIFLQSGAPSAISDITPAAGWDILNCSSDTTAQTIRIICTGDGANCEHLNQNGAKDTLVRLPENVSNI